MNIQTPNFGEVELLNFTELKKGDALYVLKMRNHPEIKKWMYNQEDITEEQHLNFLETLITDNTKHYFLVKKTDTIMGSVNFVKIDYLEKTADFGLYANPLEGITGAGRMLEEAAVYYARDKLKLAALNLEVFANNKRAISFYNNIGFKQTISRKVNDQVVFCMQKLIKESE